jgi:hypothetical protein
MLVLEAVVGTVGLLVAGWICTDEKDKVKQHHNDRRPRTKALSPKVLSHKVFVEG